MQFFDEAKRAIFEEKVFGGDSKVSDFDPEKIALNPDNIPTLEIVFDAMQIKNRCCRMRLLTKTDFDRAYK
jgi:hypothetical protein